MSKMTGMVPPAMNQDPVTQMNTYRSFVSMLVDPNAKDESKLKAVQELGADLETIISNPQYPSFLDHAIRIFLKIIQDGEPQFVSEHNTQQLRKFILEIIHRIPTNEHLRNHVRPILSLMFKLLEIENEENVLVCLRIIIELHKQFRPAFSPEIQHFLQFVKNIYKELPNHQGKIFEPRPSPKIRDLSSSLESILNETFTMTTVQSEKKNADGNYSTYNVIPRATLSLKVLAELPIIVVLMYQLYKQSVHQDVAEFIPLIMVTITLQPTTQQRNNPAFNREVFVDFMAAQIKTLSFLAYIVRIYQEVVNAHSSQLAKGMIGLLMLCPQEVAHLRKELLIAARHILATELREKFVGYLEQLFDDNILIGPGWTAYETLRPLAYSTLADLVHHVRQHLPLKDLSSAVNVFSKNIHDESLPTTIQTMSCRLMLNLVECIRTRSDREGGNGRELLMRMLEVFVLKFKTISKLQLPVLMNKSRQVQPLPVQNMAIAANQQASASAPTAVPTSVMNLINSGISEIKIEPKDDPKSPPFPVGGLQETRDEKPKFSFPPSQAATYTVQDCRALVKTLICGVKTITWGIASCKVKTATGESAPAPNKFFHPKETLVFIRLIKYSLQALDIYTLSGQAAGQPQTRNASSQQIVRSKEEKEVLEHLAGVYTMMNPVTFREVFSTSIDYMVDRIYKNYALQIVANSFLANVTTSPIFATILVEYLLNRMEEMGSNVERSNLYLKLFKLVFGSVSLFPTENEQMLKPHLHQIVNRSMELALSAKEPYNYFLLLRALFRSIGGGSHDLLYQEFLPLLPSLLQGLNSLQSGLHKQHMKDLFVELCLTVPVRLSSLLPYLPMLMDPLVSALNGSMTLVNQGLRTLELCVDNLQPDFLYDHIQPVRAELMQALWRTLRNPVDSVALVAFRVLGKFGGGNRKMMVEPQKLEYTNRETVGPCIAVYFQEHKCPVALPVEKIVETAFNALKSSSTDPFYRKQCWEIIKGFLVANIEQDDDRFSMYQLFSHPGFSTGEITTSQDPFYKFPDMESRKVHEMALTGMFVAAAIKELRSVVLPFMIALVRHYTLVAISQQCGPFTATSRQAKLQGIDPLVLADALAAIMGHEEKELCKPGSLALFIVLDTATTILQSKERACQLPFLEYACEKMCSLCYDRAWYAKLGGCISIKSLFERMTPKWVFAHQYVFLKALLFVMMDLTGEVSSGAVDMAKNSLEKMLTVYGTPVDPKPENKELVDAQRKSLNEVVQELVRQITSPNTCVREQAIHSLEVLAKVSNKSVTEIIEPHKDVLAEMIPPKKHLLRHQPINAQIGLLDANTFCITLEPRLFTMDLEIAEHKIFFQELVSICDADDECLKRLSCYKTVNNLIPLRKAVLRVLAACHYIPEKRKEIFMNLNKTLGSVHTELQDAAFQCMKNITDHYTIEPDIVSHVNRPMLLKLLEPKITLSVIQQLSFLSQLFPKSFNERLCESLLQHLHKCMDAAVTTIQAHQRTTSPEINTCSNLINVFHSIPAASPKLIEPLLSITLKTERVLLLEAGSPFREPLVKFLQLYPAETMELLLNEANIQDEQLGRFLEYLLKGDKGKPFREVLEQTPSKLVSMALGINQVSIAAHGPGTIMSPNCGLQYQSIRIVSLLVKYDDQWLSGQHKLVACLRKIWISQEFQDRHLKTDCVDYSQWKEPKLLAKCLLNFVKHHPNEIELLFQLLRAFTGRFIPDFEFLRDFLENTVANNYTVDWKRMAFFKFVELFHDQYFPQELKAKILQYILIPSFSVAFEKGEGERLIGGPPAPEQDLNENVMSIFINKVIDPEKPFGTSDAVRILLLQFSCLLVEQASPHIHDAANKRQGNKLRRLMTFAWPCLLGKNCVDPATKYHGHLLLANIIAKFAIHKRIVLQVFHSLLKAHAVEARTVVRQALEILTPAMPIRMEDGNNMLTHWTKKIIVEEGHTLAQLVHMLQLLVRHYKVYYPVRHHLIQHMVSSVQRLVFTPNATIEHKKLAVDLAEVITRWEIQRSKEEQDKITAGADKSEDPKRARNPSGTSVKSGPERFKPVDKGHSDAVVNFLLRMACQVNESSNTTGSTGEVLSRRCVNLLKMALKPEVWPDAELKLAWFDKLLTSVETPQANFGNICTALELLSFLITILKKETILATFRPLQRGIAACMTCNNPKVIRSVHSLLSRLMSLFPTEPTNSNVASKYEELECLYAAVSKVIFEGLGSYEKATSAASSALFGTLMILKAACVNNPCYIDRIITFFMRVLQKMAKEHLTPASESTPVATDLLILSLDLVKNRVGVMGQDMRKTFIGTILVGLIEKSPDVKVLKAITKMVEDWVKNKSTIALNQSPTIREKSILLVKMMQFIEKRFPNDLDLNGQFLELVNYVYRDDASKSTELHAKLEPAFMAGLRCVQPHIRAKFFEVFDSSMKRRLQERMMYMVCSQNWETMGPYFWIKQCIELVLVTSMNGTTIQSSSPNSLLPSVTSVINRADSQEREIFAMITRIKEEPMDIESVENKDEDEIDIELSTDDSHSKSSLGEGGAHGLQGKQDTNDGTNSLQGLTIKQGKFLSSLREVKTISFLNATAQLCHFDTNLAQHLWIQLYPRLWKILSEKHQNLLGSELVPFMCSGSHVVQKDCHPSAAGVFMEAVSHCDPPIHLKPLIVKYIGKSHNMWHRACLLLEQASFDKGGNNQFKYRSSDETDGGQSPHHEVLDMISEMYSLLGEEDLWSGLWQKRARFSETCAAIAYEQQGFFVQAQDMYEQTISKARTEYPVSAPLVMQSEYKLWNDHWTRCSKELNQWDHLLEYATSKELVDPYLILDSAWRVPNWSLMKEALEKVCSILPRDVEPSCPKELSWKFNLYKGYVGICHPDEHNLNAVERLVESASTSCIREWRRLPHVVSHIHLPMLQAAQQIMELQDAVQIHQGLLPANLGRQPSLHDMKAIVKTWRNRLPVVSDDLSHWSDIFTWRQHHYQAIVSSYDPGQVAQVDPQANHAMLGVHASAQSTIHFGKIARKHGLTGVCLDSLSRIHTIPSVPIVDCFQKIRQQVKCYLQMSQTGGKNELQEGLDVIESTNLKYFTKEMTAEFYAMKGMFLSFMGRAEEANKAFSSAVQLHDVLVKAWALWGDYLEQAFTKDRWESRQIVIGISALTCYLHACRHQNESKSRKYLAKVLWLLTYDDENSTLAENVDKYNVGVPPVQWLPWIPQLLTCLVRNEGRLMLNVLSQVGRVYPQAVYFPIRTLYLILKIEQREKYKSGTDPNSAGDSRRNVASPQVAQSNLTSSASVSVQSLTSPYVPSLSDPPVAPETQPTIAPECPIKATTPMWRCSRIMHMQRDLHPTVLSALEGIVDQMVWFRENVYEEVLRQLRQGLVKCYGVAFENRAAVSEANVTPHTSNFVKKLVSTFGIGVENISSVTTTFSSAASESLAKRAQATAQDPVFQKMKGQFTADFDFSVPGAMKLHNLISKLKKWIKILEAKTKLFPKSFLIEERCRYLSNFSQHTADIELPGEFLLPRHNHYYVKIARFMPRVDIVQKHNTAARRLYIKGHNGKIYPYMVVNDACLCDARREDRVMQLHRMLNNYLGKQKETSRRYLNFTVPRVVSVSPQLRLVEDNPSSISLMDIYKQRCMKRGIEYDAPLARFYERLAAVQARGSQASHQVLRDILKDVQSIMVPRGMLKEWAEQTYLGATEYWSFRKQFTLQLSLSGFAEFVLHLTRLNPDMMHLHQDSGLMNITYFRFDVDDISGELDANRPVPFRLTPNISEFITPIGICGPMTASMIATARCLVTPNFKVQSLLKAIMRDEMIAWHKKRQEDTLGVNGQVQEMEGEHLVLMVSKAVNAIMARLSSLSTFEGIDSKVSTLVAAANSHDNLCRMDPAWHPWL